MGHSVRIATNRYARIANTHAFPDNITVQSPYTFGLDNKFAEMLEALQPKQRPPRKPKTVTLRKFSWEA